MRYGGFSSNNSSSIGTRCKIAAKRLAGPIGAGSPLKQMREILSNRTYVNHIVDDLVATIG